MAGMNVSVTIKLVDQLTGGLKQAAAEMKRFGDAAKEVQRAFSGSQASAAMNSIRAQVRGLQSELKQLSAEIGRMGGMARSTSSGNMFASSIAGARQLIALQRQIASNQQRAAQVASRPPAPNTNGWLGRNGFSPNASIQDRLQYRGVNLAERSLAEGALSYDKARTNLMLKQIGLGDAEAVAQKLKGQYAEFSKSDILDTIGEIATQFKSDAEAYKLLPLLMDVQRLGILNGQTREQSRAGMLELVRGLGQTSRLTTNDGKLDLKASAEFLDAYMRAKVIGGADVNPSQAFQLVKYAKTTSQGLSKDAWLEAMIAMPDIRGSTFGNQLNMLVSQLTGRATKQALEAQHRAGFWDKGGIDPNHPEGPNKYRVGGLKEEELLRSDPSAWVKKYIMEGYLRDQKGYDLQTITGAQVAKELRPLFSNSSAENIVNMLVNQLSEYQIQVARAKALQLGPEALQPLMDQSLHFQLEKARANLVDVMGSVAENFKIMLPALQSISGVMEKISGKVDPKGSDSSPLASTGVLAGGGLAAFLAARGMMSTPIGRLLLGGGVGLATGGVSGMAMGLGGAWLSGGIARLFGMGGGAASRGLLMRLLLGGGGAMAGMSLLPLLLGSLGIGFAADAAGKTYSGWDKDQGFFGNIWRGIRESAIENYNSIRELFGFKGADAAPNMSLKPGAGNAWRGLGNQSTPQQGEEPKPGVLGPGAGNAWGSLRGKEIDTSAIPAAAQTAASQITQGGGTVAGALQQAAASIRAAAGSIASAASSIGPAGNGVVGNANRGSLGDSK